jgi:steroid 5-alpha reductase family enzyme
VSRIRATSYCSAAYLAAGAVAALVGAGLAGQAPLWVGLAADVAATVVIFGFSVGFRNSSFYDPYWSVAPFALGVYWAAGAGVGAASSLRQGVVLALVLAWGARLTLNFLRGWKGLAHEDWRYVDLRMKSGRAYWPVSFLGIHLFPTLIVFAGCLSLYVAVTRSARPFGLLDGVATVVTVAAIVVEAVADAQLRGFVRAPDRKATDILATGLWGYSRHPNYFGEMLFWWGLYLFALAADPRCSWAGIGPLAITLMFHAISLPMMEARMSARRPEFRDRIRRVSAFVPWFPKRG